MFGRSIFCLQTSFRQYRTCFNAIRSWSGLPLLSSWFCGVRVIKASTGKRHQMQETYGEECIMFAGARPAFNSFTMNFIGLSICEKNIR